jgi:phospholipid-binding lipoprotein MlaA
MLGVSMIRFALRVAAICAVGCAAAATAQEINNDPIEPVNRGIFWFNEQLDEYVLVPAAKGWRWIAPVRVRESVTNFFENLLLPIDLANNLLQGKLVRSGSTVARFAVNTTAGVLGFFDPATEWGLERHSEDFGQTLGYWGVPPGPYLVLPLWGPSSPRDGIGLAADGFCTVYPWFVPFYYTFGSNALNLVNARARVLTDVEELKRASLDYYVAVRNAYQQRREAVVNDGSGLSEAEQQELYTVPEDAAEGE